MIVIILVNLVIKIVADRCYFVIEEVREIIRQNQVGFTCRTRFCILVEKGANGSKNALGVGIIQFIGEVGTFAASMRLHR